MLLHLAPDWRDILRRAWSARLILLAGVLTGIEVVLPLFWSDLPRGLFAGLSGVVTAGALVARVVAQKGLS